MPEVRTTSATGGQKGVKLARFDLIPAGPLTELAEHFGVGALKYAGHQWRQGYEWSKSIAAKARHDAEFLAGRDYDVCSNDPEGCSHFDADGEPFVAPREDACYNHTGSHHLAASAWHAFVLLEFKDRFPAFDDRYDPAVDDEKYIDATEPDRTFPEGWEEAGWIDGDEFDYADLMPFQDAINRAITKLAEIVDVPEFVVQWRDPAPMTAEAVREYVADHYVQPVRFVTGVEGTEDFGPDLLKKHRPWLIAEEPQYGYIEPNESDLAADAVEAAGLFGGLGHGGPSDPTDLSVPSFQRVSFIEFDVDLADWSVPAVDVVGEDD